MTIKAQEAMQNSDYFSDWQNEDPDLGNRTTYINGGSLQNEEQVSEMLSLLHNAS